MINISACMMWLHAVFKPSSSRGLKRGENQKRTSAWSTRWIKVYTSRTVSSVCAVYFSFESR